MDPLHPWYPAPFPRHQGRSLTSTVLKGNTVNSVISLLTWQHTTSHCIHQYPPFGIACAGSGVPSWSDVQDTRRGKQWRRWRDLQTLPSAVRRPFPTLSGRAQLYSDKNQEGPPERSLQSSSPHLSSHGSMSPTPAIDVPMPHEV